MPYLHRKLPTSALTSLLSHVDRSLSSSSVASKKSVLGHLERARAIGDPTRMKAMVSTEENLKPTEESVVYNLRTRGYNLRTRPTMAAARKISSFRYYKLKLQATDSSQRQIDNCTWTFSITKKHDPEIGKNKSHPQPHLTVANNTGHHRVYGWNRNILIDDIREDVAIMIESRHGGCKQCNKVWLEIKCRNFRAFVPLVLT